MSKLVKKWRKTKVILVFRKTFLCILLDKVKPLFDLSAIARHAEQGFCQLTSPEGDEIISSSCRLSSSQASLLSS